MRRIVPALVTVLLVAGCAGLPASTGPTPGPSDTPGSVDVQVTVVEVVDGDTIDVAYPNGTRDTVRLLGVDSPETGGGITPEEFEGVPDTRRGRECLATWADGATAFTRERLQGETVTLTFDANEPRRGAYGRLLAYVHLEGRLFNDRLVSRGYARVYDSSFVKREAFYAAESRAQSNGTGLWECRSVPGGTVTPADGGLTIEEVHPDAAGNDHENPNDEYVVLRNAGEDELALGG